ncbi:MmgE/PrpD family protein [Sphingomonas sp. GC_Shp_3]|uniref:MmgE/PrpD family protein n=1 Tax=Sphingomonas sp. GC_Shp_3 TaxID=2937383 RepID=UPI00226AC321|nr:MmgE/PrpD family protein [Sphingomonas sp. GC_Shp_3]
MRGRTDVRSIPCWRRTADMLSDRIATHIAEMPYAALSPHALDMTRLALLDAIGVMLGASGLSPEATPFRDLALASGTGPSLLLGGTARVPATAAAFANGALAHALDYEDAFDRAPCHPNAALVPALLALAEARGATATEFLAAMAIGCDLTCRMALALGAPMEAGGWYPPPILGAFGATAGAARLLGLDAAQTRSALSLALCQATAPGEIKHSVATTIRAVREAFPAQAAVTAALLAHSGVIGFESPLEGEGGFYRLYADGMFDEVVLLDGLGERVHGEQLSFKRWPACRGTHAYIEAALRLRERLGGAWQHIAAITITVGDVQRMLVEPPARKQAPATAIDAKFSIFYTVACALVRGAVGLQDFDGGARIDADLLALTARMAAIHDTAQVATAFGGIVTATLDDGSVLREAVMVPLGHPDRPIATAALIDKFVACAGEAALPYNATAAGALAERLLSLGGDTNVATLLARD